ncbi:MAG: monovalent cation/H+ antiporter complex subunit F [Rickettsiales bacterium]
MINTVFILFAISLLIYVRAVCVYKNMATRLIALNSVVSILSVLIVVTGVVLHEGSYIDIAILYALFGYISNIAFMKILRN